MSSPFAPSGAKRYARGIVALLAAILLTAPAQAGERGNGKGNGRGQAEKAEKVGKDQGAQKKSNGKFSSDDRAAVRAYYAKSSNCPPGLAKKDNGCLPPGQAKKMWTVGTPLPPAVTFEVVPAELTVHLALPPIGHRYVQVAGDILMIAEGSRLVVDAIVDLGR